MEKNDIKNRIMKEDGYAVAALLELYAHQTEVEKSWGTTKENNGVGFNGMDSGICSSMAEQYKKKGYLTPKQIAALRKILPKYSGQLDRTNLTPVPIRPPATAPTPQGNPKKAILDADTITIKFPYDPEMVGRVKTLHNRKWNPTTKSWTAPVCDDTIRELNRWGFEFNEALKQEKAKLDNRNNLVVEEIPGLRMALFPYQADGVSRIETLQGRAILADEMGLGKTCQALSWLQLHPELRPAVIVVPASLKLNWEREAKMWMSNPEVQVLQGKPNGERKLGKDIIIVNYDILANDFDSRVEGDKKIRKEIPGSGWVDHLVEHEPKVIITDECHYYKNSGADRTKAVMKLAKGVDHVIAMSGTPIVNRPIEFYNAISIVRPTLFPSFFKYTQRYCGAVHNGFGWDFQGASHTEELHEILTSRVMIRRKKADVLKDLPAKMRNVVPLQISNQKEYKIAEENFIGWLNGIDPEKAQAAERAEALVRIEGLKQLSFQGKMQMAVEWISDFLENDKKLVVFAVHKNVVDELMKKFKNIAVKIDGSTPNAKRQEAVDAFQNNDKVRLFVGNIKAAGVGITLTEASDTCFVELGWTPGDHDQAEDRVHRIGQEADSVNAWYLIAENTIEENILDSIDNKRQVLNKVLDGQDAASESMLGELLMKMKERKQNG